MAGARSLSMLLQCRFNTLVVFNMDSQGSKIPACVLSLEH